MSPKGLDVEALQKELVNHLIGCRILYFDSLTSSMDQARSEAERGATEGTTLITEEQTQGRGRFQRSWLSPKGLNLLFSVILHPQTQQLNRMNMAASLSVARAIHKLSGLGPTIKWPNDVRLNGKKVAGVLIESVLENGDVKYAIVGIGMNVNWHPPEDADLAYPATSISKELGVSFSRALVLKAILQEMETLYSTVKRGGSLKEEWSRMLDTLGKPIRVGHGKELLEGIAQDVDEEGNLLLLKSDGSTVKIVAGEVTLQA